MKPKVRSQGLNLPCTGDDEQTKTETATAEMQQSEGRKLAQGWLQSAEVSWARSNGSLRSGGCGFLLCYI